MASSASTSKQNADPVGFFVVREPVRHQLPPPAAGDSPTQQPGSGNWDRVDIPSCVLQKVPNCTGCVSHKECQFCQNHLAGEPLHDTCQVRIPTKKRQVLVPPTTVFAKIPLPPVVKHPYVGQLVWAKNPNGVFCEGVIKKIQGFLPTRMLEVDFLNECSDYECWITQKEVYVRMIGTEAEDVQKISVYPKVTRPPLQIFWSRPPGNPNAHKILCLSVGLDERDYWQYLQWDGNQTMAKVEAFTKLKQAQQRSAQLGTIIPTQQRERQEQQMRQLGCEGLTGPGDNAIHAQTLAANSVLEKHNFLQASDAQRELDYPLKNHTLTRPLQSSRKRKARLDSSDDDDDEDIDICSFCGESLNTRVQCKNGGVHF